MSAAQTTITSIDDISSDVGHLATLLDVVVEHTLNDLQIVIDGKRNAALERITALLWIARDMAEKAERDIEDNIAGRSPLEGRRHG
jgi:hypothetical protein